MQHTSLWKAVGLVALLQIVIEVRAESTEVTYLKACEVCVCGPGPNSKPKELVKCHDSPNQLKIVSLPDFVRGIEIINARHGVEFMRGAIRVRDNFKVVVDNSSLVDFHAKSTTILTKQGQVTFALRQIKHLRLRSRAVSSSSGSFELQVEQSGLIDIEGQAFDVINKVKVDKVQKLNLAAAALKPNAQSLKDQPFTQIWLEEIASIPILSMEVFSSAHSIVFVSCQIDEIDSSAFSGNSVFNITFHSCSIDRIHTSAFPDKALLQNLAFVKSRLRSISEKSVASAISSLTISACNVSSISSEAFDTMVAKVNITDCTFKTLVSKSFVFRSWDEVILSSNNLQFIDDDALFGITEPNSPSLFTFASNQIQSANRNGLRLNPLTKMNKTTDNSFAKACECDLDKWIMVVSGETNFKNPSSWSIALLNTSYCEVPQFASTCFSSKQVYLRDYAEQMCSIMASNQDCSYVNPWEIIQDQIQINTNKGILLIVLIFALASTLVIGILTLCRWIVYTIQARKFYNNDDNWNFTKIEEQQKLKENIIEEEVIEEAIELEESSPSSSNEHYEALGNATSSIEKENEPLLEVKLPEHASEGKPPTQTTFYDEMICLLQEKLEDPENYSTVVDDKDLSGNNATLYMDPLNLNKNKS